MSMLARLRQSAITAGYEWDDVVNLCDTEMLLAIRGSSGLLKSKVSSLFPLIASPDDAIDGDVSDISTVFTPSGLGVGSTVHSSLTLDDGTNPHGTTKSDVGLSNADNTSDINKPVSLAAQSALDLKANLNHASRHLPGGADPIATGAAVASTTGSSNTAGSANTFSRSDHTHKIEVNNQFVEQGGETQTTSPNFVLLPGMTITPVQGTYIAIASVTHFNNTNAVLNRLAIFAGGVQSSVTHELLLRNNFRVTTSILAVASVSGSQAIEIRWNRSGGTASAFARQLMIARVA